MKRIMGMLLVFLSVIALTGCGCSKEKQYSVVCSKKTQEGKITFTEQVGADLKNGKIEEATFTFTFENENDADDYIDTLRNTYKNGDIKIDGKTVTIVQKVAEGKNIDKAGFTDIYNKLGYNCK